MLSNEEGFGRTKREKNNFYSVPLIEASADPFLTNSLHGQVLLEGSLRTRRLTQATSRVKEIKYQYSNYWTSLSPRCDRVINTDVVRFISISNVYVKASRKYKFSGGDKRIQFNLVKSFKSLCFGHLGSLIQYPIRSVPKPSLLLLFDC